MKNLQKLIPSLFTIIVGILFVMLKGGVLAIAVNVIGIALVVLAVLALVNKSIPLCIVYAVMAAVVFVAGGLFLTIAIYLIAAILLIHGIAQLYALFTAKKLRSAGATAILLVAPILNVIAGICLLFNVSGTIAWVFMLVGVLLIIDGVMSLANLLDGKSTGKKKRRK